MHTMTVRYQGNRGKKGAVHTDRAEAPAQPGKFQRLITYFLAVK